MQSAFVGIDVAFAKNKLLPVSMMVRHEDRLSPLPLATHGYLRPPRGEGNRAILNPERVRSFAADAVAYVVRSAEHFDLEIARIAIDAPSDYCEKNLARRAAENAMDRAGISCFATPTKSRFQSIIRKASEHVANGLPDNRLPHANQLWMLVGFELFRAFRHLGECRETFPQAIIRSLGGGKLYKSSREGLLDQFTAVSAATGWAGSLQDLSRVGFGADHDRLDALMCAWVASLNEDQLRAYGQPPNDVIWVPRVERDGLTIAGGAEAGKYRDPKRRRSESNENLKPIASESVIDDPAGLPACELTNRAVKCPACHEIVFSRWPLGWDAHAAHKCSGLSETEPEARKREFKTRYRGMFS
jgi:hypothetical protein